MSLAINFDPATHTFTRPGDGTRVRSVTQILAAAELCDYSCVPAEFRDRGMKRGSSVHWMTQLEDQGALNYRMVPKALRPFRKGWNDWKKATGFKPIAIEHIFTWDNAAGIMDRVGTFPASTMHPTGSHALIDLKTGHGPIQDWVRYQLSAYSVGWMQSVQLARYLRRIAVLLKPDGTYSVKEFPREDFDRDYSTFVRAKGKANAEIKYVSPALS